jgi:hypothetical protein
MVGTFDVVVVSVTLVFRVVEVNDPTVTVWEVVAELVTLTDKVVGVAEIVMDSLVVVASETLPVGNAIKKAP